MDQEDITDQITAACFQPLFHNKDLAVTDQHSAPPRSSPDTMSSQTELVSSSTDDTDPVIAEDGLSNGTGELDTVVALRCPGDSGDVDTAVGGHLALSNDSMSEFSNTDFSLPEVCISTNSNSFEDDMSYEVQQAYRIFTGFLLDKHKSITGPFLHPIGEQEAQRGGVGGAQGWAQAEISRAICLQRMEEKFVNREYETITEFVADFRLMLESCYRHHGVDHWISKQAQKLEIMLEQKLTLLSRTLREKTNLAVTSKGRFGAEEERSSGGTSTRRRTASRSLATITVGGHESIMVQTLRLEEQQRVKDEKRQRELEKKEAEEMSAKEVEEWEQTLLSEASPHTLDTLWELPAIGHFLCLAQSALNLPEIVFFELERCLLMPRCSPLLSKIMSSLLSPPQRRATLQRHPALPYRRWESELRQRVMGWYRAVGASHDQPGRAEQMGLCHQFFRVLGEVSPLEEKPFHLLPFYQRLWLLKGLCDNVYETQKDVQNAVLSQPIHECRESILGYDSKENAFIHFPHFCGADLRVYCQSPSTTPTYPFPSVLVKSVEKEPGTEGDESDGMKDEGVKHDKECYGVSIDTGELEEFGTGSAKTLGVFKGENRDEEDGKKRIRSWPLKKEEGSESGSSDRDSCDSKSDLTIHSDSISLSHTSPMRVGGKIHLKEETGELAHKSKRLASKRKQGSSLGSIRTIKAETQEPCLSVGEHSYTGRSPARLVSLASSTKPMGLKMEGGNPSQGHQRSFHLECCKSKTGNVKFEEQTDCRCSKSGVTAALSSDSAQNSSEERVNNKIWSKKRKRKKKRGRDQLQRVKGEHTQLQLLDRMRFSPAETEKSAMRRVATTIKRKDKKKKHKTGKKLESSKKMKYEAPVQPSFKLVCTSLQELRELISRTEDELDDLESTKKRLGRWYYKREAVKDLHSTLIRLLNELSPWEPKLVKAYQRNRLRLKKEFDDFKKHPDYNNFVREEFISSSSSSSSDDDEEDAFGKELGSISDHYGRAEEEDLEHRVPRSLWSGAREFGAEPAGERTVTDGTPNHLACPPTGRETGVGLLTRSQSASSNMSSAPDSGPQFGSEGISLNQSRDSNSAWAANATAQTSLSPRPPILHPTTRLPKGYTPIPTLLAKSVGNKVTLMKRPPDINNLDGPGKEPLVSPSTYTVTTAKLSKAQSSPFSPQQHALQEIKLTAALPKSPQPKPIQTVPKNIVGVVYKAPERKDGGNPVKISVHPVMDQNHSEKVMQQVVILPSKRLVKKNEDNVSSLDQKPSFGVHVPPVSKMSSPLRMSTNVPGFSIPENRIPVQQVAPLKDARTAKTPSLSVFPNLQQVSPNKTFNGAQVCRPQVSTTPSVTPNPSPVTTSSYSVFSEPLKSTVNPKQELKTVCIRDSQSILVTTRGGNTGIVKVQTSSDQNALGYLSTTPVITISPQFKAFLVSKTSQNLSQPAASQTSSPSTIPAVTVAQPQTPDPSALKSPFNVTAPMITAVTGGTTGGIGPESQTAGSKTSAGSTAATKIGQPAQTAAASSCFPASLFKNAVVVPSLGGSGIPQVLTQAELIGKTAVKRTIRDERSQVTKFILVTPSSSSSPSTVALSKGTPSSTKALPTSRVMFISQPTAAASATSFGSVPKQAMAPVAGGPLLTNSISGHALKMELSPGQSVSGVNSEAFSNVKNITLPPGVQIQLSGKTTTIGQTIGALSRSPSKTTQGFFPDACRTTSTTTGLVPVTSPSSVTMCSTQIPSHVPLTTSSQFPGIPSFPSVSQPGLSTSFPATLPTGNVINKDLGVMSSNFPAQALTRVQSTSAPPTHTSTLVHQRSNIQSGIVGENNSFSSSSQLALNKQTPISLASTNFTPSATAASGTIQQKIVINTSTPLAAGTQILLNNTRFVVPPPGLGPGSHVLIFSNPAPQQVPTAGATSTGALVSTQGASHVTVAAQAQVLPESRARVPGVPAVSSSFVAYTPCPPSLATTPNVTPVRLTETPGIASAFLNSKTNVVSALPKLPMSQAGRFASPSVGINTLLSPPRLVSVPALVSPAVTSAPVLGSGLTSVRLAAGTSTQAGCSFTVSQTVANPLSRFSAPLSSYVLPNQSALAFPSPVIPPLSSAAEPAVAGSPSLKCYLPSQQLVSATSTGTDPQPRHTTVEIAAPSSSLSKDIVHTGLSCASMKKNAPAVVQPVLAGTRKQVLPSVAVPPIVSAVSRMQTLPIATVPPIGSNIVTFKTPPVGAAPSSSCAVIISPAQPITSLKTNNTIHPPVVLNNQALGIHSLQTSSLGMDTKVASKLLISPDGAVLNTVQCCFTPAQLTACTKPLEALVVPTNSSTEALHTHDSSLQPSQTDGKSNN